MEFTEYDLGQQPEGATVVVSLAGTEANVLLLDRNNLQRYKGGGQFEYFGGLAQRSPYRLAVPRAGHWFVVIDLGGAVGEVGSSVEVFE
jgi:hypothetical protein